MEGSVFITYQNGWSCSNDCYLDIEKDLDLKAKTSVTTMVLKVKGIFIGKGEIIKDNIVSLVFRNENNENLGFNGYIRMITEDKVNIVLTTKHNKSQELLNKIKEEIHNGR